MSYDNAGDVKFDGVNQYLYDAEGRVCAVNNGLTITGYIYGGAGELLTEITAGVWDHSNVYGPTGLLATYHDTNTYFALNDWQGTKRAELSAAGCFETFASLPFGDDLTSEGNCPDASEQHFTGKERDAESGNDFFGARYYSSTMSRWLSPDWSEKAEPVLHAKMDMPQSLNLYGYVGNNPLSKVDADGHIAKTGGILGPSLPDGTATEATITSFYFQDPDDDTTETGAAANQQAEQQSNSDQQQSQSNQPSPTNNSGPTSAVCSEDGPHIVRDAGGWPTSDLHHHSGCPMS
jgi:RHS repeat-associated protein